MSRPVSRLRGTAYLTASRVVNIILSFFAVRLYFDVLGAEQYGLVLFSVVFIAYYNLFDLGIQYSTGLRYAQLVEKEETDELKDCFRTTLGLTLIFASVALVLFSVGGYVYSRWYAQDDLANWPWLLPLVAITPFFHFLQHPLGSLNFAHERYDVLLKYNSLNSLLLNLLPMALVYFFRNPYAHVGGSAIAAFLFFATFAGIVHKHHGVSWLIPKIDKGHAKDLITTGIPLLWSKVPGTIAGSLERFIIGPANPATLASYTTSGRIPEVSRDAYRSATDTSFQAMAKAGVDPNRDFLEVMSKYLRMVTVGALVVVLIPAAFAHPILAIWLPEQVAAFPYMPVIMMILGWFALNETYNQMFGMCALAKGVPKLLVYFSIYQVIAKAIFSFLGFRYYGVIGLAAVNMGVSFSQVIPMALVYHRVLKLSGSPWRTVREYGAILALGGSVFALGVWVAALLMPISPWLALLALPPMQLAVILLAKRLDLAPYPEALLKLLGRLGLA